MILSWSAIRLSKTENLEPINLLITKLEFADLRVHRFEDRLNFSALPICRRYVWNRLRLAEAHCGLPVPQTHEYNVLLEIPTQSWRGFPASDVGFIHCLLHFFQECTSFLLFLCQDLLQGFS